MTDSICPEVSLRIVIDNAHIYTNPSNDNDVTWHVQDALRGISPLRVFYDKPMPQDEKGLADGRTLYRAGLYDLEYNLLLTTHWIDDRSLIEYLVDKINLSTRRKLMAAPETRGSGYADIAAVAAP